MATGGGAGASAGAVEPAGGAAVESAAGGEVGAGVVVPPVFWGGVGGSFVDGSVGGGAPPLADSCTGFGSAATGVLGAAAAGVTGIVASCGTTWPPVDAVGDAIEPVGPPPVGA